MKKTELTDEAIDEIRKTFFSKIISIQFREAIATHEKGLAMWTEFMVSFQSLAVTP